MFTLTLTLTIAIVIVCCCLFIMTVFMNTITSEAWEAVPSQAPQVQRKACASGFAAAVSLGLDDSFVLRM